MAEPIPAKVRDTVLARAAGRCERCGRHVQSLELHHRKFRSRGGHHTIENIVALCGWGNHTGCHGAAHSATERYDNGWAVRTGTDPHLMPVMYRGWRVMLTAEGGIA